MKSAYFLIPAILILIISFGVTYEYMPRDIQIVENLEFLNTMPESNKDNPDIWNVLENSRHWLPARGTGSFPRNRQGILWLRIRLPYFKSVPDAQYLLFSRVDQLFEVYYQRKLIYAFGKIQTPPENSRYIGTPHHLIRLPEKGTSDYLYIRVYSQYTRIGIVGRILSGEKSSLVEYYFFNNIERLLFGSVYLICALALAIVYLSFTPRQNHWLDLALFSLAAGGFFICNSGIGQFVIPNAYGWMLLQIGSVFLVPVGLLGFLRNNLFVKGKNAVLVMQVFAPMFGLPAMVLIIMEVMQISTALIIFEVYMLICILVLLVLLFANLYSFQKQHILLLLGLTAFILSGTFDILTELGLFELQQRSHLGLFIMFILFSAYGAGVSLRDLTRARHMEEIYRSKMNFTATINHELRTPLNGILGMVELLSRSDLDTRQKNYVETIQHSGKLLLDLINNVLGYARLEAGVAQLNPEAVNLESTVATVIENIQTALHKNGNQIEYEFKGGMRKAALIDKLGLQQLLYNLIGNAAKFTRNGRIDVTFTDESQGDREILMIRVADTGCGIPADKIVRLFEPFYQVEHSLTRSHGGTGLGLAITKQLVQAMNGFIDVISKPDVGTTFTLTLPVTYVQNKVSSAFNPSGSGEAGSTKSMLRILVAEDNDINARILIEMLAQLGYNCQLARDGTEALQMIEAKSFDLLILDLEMPGYSGLEIIQKTRRNGSNRNEKAYAIAYTAHTTSEIERECYLSGFNTILSKPLTLGQLAAALGQITVGVT